MLGLTLESSPELFAVLYEQKDRHPNEEVHGEHEQGEADEVDGVPRVFLLVHAHESCETLEGREEAESRLRQKKEGERGRVGREKERVRERKRILGADDVKGKEATVYSVFPLRGVVNCIESHNVM